MSAWDSPQFVTEAGDWAEVALAPHGVELTQPATMLKARDWSCVLALDTTAGPMFLKAASPPTRFEPALTVALAGLGDGAVLQPLAVDTDRGWMILPHGGEELRRLESARERWEVWERTLGLYAQLQRDAARDVEPLLAAGVPDFRLERYAALLDELAPADRAGVERRAAPLVERLLAGPIPPSVQHDDLHGGNILVRDGVPVLFDWGDASLAHPFMSLTVAQRVWRHTGELDGENTDTARLVAAYLRPWADLASPTELEQILADAVRLGMLWRAFTYQRLALALPRPLHEVIDGAAEGWTELFLEDG